MGDSKYVTREMYIPDRYVFIDARPMYAVVIHKTASPGMATAESIAEYFQRGSDGREVSSHYVIGKDGHVIQCVREKDGAGANCAQPVEPGRNNLFNANVNWNLRTITVEHVDDSLNNSQDLTDTQKSASFHLIADICERKGIAPDHVVEHKDLQPSSKPNCAGNYPLNELRRYIESKQHVTNPKRNKNNEVVDVRTTSQFLPSKTEYACGFFAVSGLRYSGEPGKGPKGTVEEVDKWAFDQYTREYGSDGANIVGGVSIDDMHRLLLQGLPESGTSHYMDLPIKPDSSQASDLAQVKGALHSGYPVVVTVTEASIIDKELGKNPYYWGASGKHVFLITGIDNNGDFLVHDPANVVGPLQGNNSARPQPRHYDHHSIDMTWASMARMPWLKPFPANWNAATGEVLNQDIPENKEPVQVQRKKPDINEEVVEIWELIVPNLPRNTPIFGVWRSDHLRGVSHGVPLGAPKDGVDIYGDKVTRQAFSESIAIQKGNKVIWQ